MSSERQWRDGSIVGKVASTRPTRLRSGQTVVVTRPALEGIAEQVRTGFIPMNVEHLSLFPPIGRWYDADVVTADDGAGELVLQGKLLRRLVPVDADPDPWRVLPEERGDAGSAKATITELHVTFANFDAASIVEATKTAPVDIVQQERWSELPPMEWILMIPVLWGATRFAGSFLDELGRESASAIVGWIADLAPRAKDAERTNIVTLHFSLPDNVAVYGFIPVNAGSALEDEVLAAVSAASSLAELAGAHAAGGVLGDAVQTAFFWRDAQWHLAWSVHKDDTVRVTNWFMANEPDPSRFLGRPVRPDE